MSITIRELVTKLGFSTDAKKVDEFNRKLDLTKKKFEDISKQSFKTGRALTLGLTAPIAALSGFAIKAASDAEEINSKFATIFKDIRKESDDTAKTFAKNFLVSGTKAKELLGNTADLLTGFGFTQDAALDLSKQVNELGADLASFGNFSGGVEGASAALTKALLGERESVKSLGIVINEDLVKKQTAINVSNGLTFATKMQAKAFATLQIAQSQSVNAIGDVARTSASFANRMREFRARLQDVSETFGNILLPKATAFLNVVIKLMERITELSAGTKKFILISAGLLAVIGPLFLAFGFFAGALVKIVAAYQILTKAVLIFKSAMIAANLAAFAIPAAIAAAVVAVFLIIEDLIAFFKGKNSVTGVIVDKFKEMVPKVIGAFNNMITGIISAFKSRFPALFEFTKELGSFWISVFKLLFSVISEMVKFAGAVLVTMKNMITSTFSFIAGVVKNSSGFIKAVFENLKDIMLSPFIAVKDIISSVFGLINKLLKSQLFSTLISGPTDLLKKASRFIGKAANNKSSNIIDNVNPLINGVQNMQGSILGGSTPPRSLGAGSSNNVFNIKLDAPISVDQNTSVENIGGTIKQGLENGLSRVLRETARANAPALEF